MRALVVVGSWARGDARPDSDVDIILLTTDRGQYFESVAWTSDLGTAPRVTFEEYGKATSVRAVYGDGLEVEFAVVPANWASAPFDPGTEAVARNGIAVLLDRDGHVTALARAFGGPV